jgi:predicted dithiol-disulfide oxidoreductase (DUF899 family)
MYFAVSVKTESGDDYIILANVETPADLIAAVKARLGSEFNWVSDFMVDFEGKWLGWSEETAAFEDELGEAFANAFGSEEEES